MRSNITPLAIYLFVLNIFYSAVGHTGPSVGVRCTGVYASTSLSQFETDILRSQEAIKNLKLKSENIKSVYGRLHTGGVFAAGILRVQTTNGNFVLKVLQEGNPLSEFAPSIVIQNELARRGLAPQVHGVLNSVSISKLLEKIPSTRSLLQEQDVSFGVLMDEIPIVSHITAGHVDFIPKTWSKERLEQRIREIENALSELRIPGPEDLQLVFTRDDRLLLLDFDTYFHFTKNGLVIGPFLGGAVSISRYISDYQPVSFRDGETTIQTNGELRVRLQRIRGKLGLPPRLD